MKTSNPQSHQLPQLKILWQQAFHESMDSFLAAAFSTDRCLIAQENDQVVAMLHWFDLDYQGHRLAYLYAIATEASHQHKGIGKALVSVAHGHLKALGYDGAILVPATEDLFAFYRRCGFEQTIFGFLREATDFVGEKVTWQQYKHAREALLPPGSPVARDAVYQYLDTYCDFYLGEHTCLCRASSGAIQEILPHTPTDKPFALFLPFAENIPTPTYFAFPMD